MKKNQKYFEKIIKNILKKNTNIFFLNIQKYFSKNQKYIEKKIKHATFQIKLICPDLYVTILM